MSHPRTPCGPDCAWCDAHPEQAHPRPAPRLCDQRCGAPATVYAIDPHPGGWGGYYCEPCTKALRFQVVDRL